MKIPMSKSASQNDQSTTASSTPADNSRRKFSMEFDVGDILMIADALMIGTTTAMMCAGNQHKERLDQLTKQFLELSPIPKKSRSDGYAWFSACQKLRTARTYEAFAKQEDGYRTLYKGKAIIHIQVDDKVFKIGDHIPEEEAQAAISDINSFLEEISPIDSDLLTRFQVQVVLPDDGKSRWDDKTLSESVKDAMDSAFNGSDFSILIREFKNDWDYDREKGDAALVTISAPSRHHEAIKELIADANQQFESAPSLKP